ncbi:MAG TPA: TetR/AcrR family transcriptional regulator [Rhizomicrobium sp.]|nr:TetR/AcrR family transcriptional regulator [Rhizomicrobium sp.]
MNTQDRIFKAARKLFDEKGLEGVSLRNVAKKIGITPMAIYRHFEDKEALIDALVLDGLAEWSARVEALPPCKGLAKLEQIGEAYLDFALKEPRRYEAAFLLPSRQARRYPDDFLAGRSPAGNIQLKVLEEAIAEGLIAAAPIEILITNAGLSQGLITLYRAGRIAGGEDEFRALYRRAMQRSTESFLKEKKR